jgi:hypothetical protein
LSRRFPTVRNSQTRRRGKRGNQGEPGTSERKKLAIGETVTAKDGKSYVAREKTRIFEVRGWQKATE